MQSVGLEPNPFRNVYLLKSKSTQVKMKKDDFKEKAYQIVNDLADRIDKLEAKANEIADDKKNEYQEQLDKLKETRDKLALKLKEYERLTEGKWNVIRESAGSFFGSVAEAWRENYRKVADAFREKEPKEPKDT